MVDLLNNEVYTDRRITVVSSLDEIKKEMLDHEIVMDDYVAVLLLKGSAELSINNEVYRMEQNQMLFGLPSVVLRKLMISVDAELKALSISGEYVEEICSLEKDSVNIRIFLKQNPVFSIDEDSARVFCQYCDLLRSRLAKKDMLYQKEILESLLAAFKYEFGGAIMRRADIPMAEFTSADSIYKQFLVLLETSSPKYHQVAYYAEKLNITPKYFSTVCKKITGKTALQVIDMAVVRDAEALLRRNDMNIKQISAALGFPNQSFFGRYVKKKLGVSPQKYRENHANYI
ncbi:MAG: AraC family transcriptional regulator [Bacteroidaceae bacterium]|nr:AraC family transcriptional regulator [Bacteroidaceae bacterium]